MVVQDGENKFDYYLRLGKIRPSMKRNRAITTQHMEVGAQIPPYGKLPSKEHTYGLYKVRGKYDYVWPVISEWNTFDQDVRLRRYARESRFRDCAKANMAALDAGMSNAKDWNRFCMSHKQEELYRYISEFTQRSFLENRKVRVPERKERGGPLPELMPRIMSNDYGREYFLREWAKRRHENNVRQIDARMLGAKFNTGMEVHQAKSRSHQLNRIAERQRASTSKPLAAIRQTKKLRETVSHVATFREGDKHNAGWRPQKRELEKWDHALKI